MGTSLAKRGRQRAEAFVIFVSREEIFHDAVKSYGEPMCVLVGVQGSAFPVDTKENDWTADLNDAIKAKESEDISRAADRLQLYWTSTSSAWLETSSGDAQKLTAGENTTVAQAMMNEDKELAVTAPLFPAAVGVWERRFECLGIVPRLVLQDLQHNPEKLLTIACNNLLV